MNRSIVVNHVYISNFLNNECVNIYVTWYQSYNFLFGRRNLNYKHGMECFV